MLHSAHAIIIGMSTDGQRKKRFVLFSSGSVMKQPVFVVAMIVIAALLIGGGLWAFYSYQASKDATVEQGTNAIDNTNIVEQTEANKIETKTSELLANEDIDGLNAYYVSLIQGTSDTTAQANYYLQLASSLFTAYPDTQEQAVRTAAYKAEELQPTATTADFIAVIEEYYGNNAASVRYRTLYNERVGDMGEVE